jgi:hypothetical protein
MTQQLQTSVIAEKLVKPMTDLALLVAPSDLKDMIQTRMPR